MIVNDNRCHCSQILHSDIYSALNFQFILFSIEMIVFVLLFISTLVQTFVTYETNSKYNIYIYIDLMVIA